MDILKRLIYVLLVVPQYFLWFTLGFILLVFLGFLNLAIYFIKWVSQGENVSDDFHWFGVDKLHSKIKEYECLMTIHRYPYRSQLGSNRQKPKDYYETCEICGHLRGSK